MHRNNKVQKKCKWISFLKQLYLPFSILEKIKTLLNYSRKYNISFSQTSKEPGLEIFPGENPIRRRSIKPLTFYRRFSRF